MLVPLKRFNINAKGEGGISSNLKHLNSNITLRSHHQTVPSASIRPLIDVKSDGPSFEALLFYPEVEHPVSPRNLHKLETLHRRHYH